MKAIPSPHGVYCVHPGIRVISRTAPAYNIGCSTPRLIAFEVRFLPLSPPVGLGSGRGIRSGRVIDMEDGAWGVPHLVAIGSKGED